MSNVRVLAVLRWSVDESRLDYPVSACFLKRMQAQDQSQSCLERPASATSSFSGKGQAGGGQQVMSLEQVPSIEQCHEHVMCNLGYLEVGS